LQEELRRRVETFLRGNPRRKLWAVINNASSNMMAPIDWIPVSEFERLMQVNYMGVVRMTKCFLPLLKETKGSRIINVASALGHLSSASFGAYAPTKAAMQSFTKTLSMEMAQFGELQC
jgi:NAD(P)-dependent dehydrogenase (short-subunit alcohol dehydrogenase family)